MLDNDERSVRIATTGGVTVDGVVRVRGVHLRRRGVRLSLGRLDPIAVVVKRPGRTDRIALTDGGASARPLAWLAMPLAAGITARILRSRRKKGA